MFNIKNNKITLTRGDSMAAEIALTTGEGDPYEPQEGDTIRFVLKSERMNPSRSAYMDRVPLIEKPIATGDMTLRLIPGDTKKLPFGNYCYDIEITFADGYVDTFINNEEFILAPEVD